MSTFTPTDLVQLPRTGASAALALGRQVLAAAAAQKPFPKSAVKAHGALAAAHGALQAAMVDQLGDGTAEDPEAVPGVRDLDRTLDNCWGGTDDRLAGLSKLPPGTPGAAEAAALRKRLFPKGLAFLKLPFRLQWSESQLRLDLIERDNLAPALDTVAGKHFLPAIVAAHAAYGKALGMDKPLADAAAIPLVRGALDTFTNALRSYVVKVMGSVDDDAPATQTAADALLAPLANWPTTSPKRPKDDAPAEGAAARLAPGPPDLAPGPPDAAADK